LSRSYSGRVKEVQVVGTTGSRTVRGETFRIAAGLASTLFNVAPVGEGQPTEFSFAGRGWGHGLGLSQWGARGLAEQGYTYMQILGHYYPGAQLGRL
jgi:stage II sporulation protein D